mmetsp:Transcript_49274/g.143429  ORF Transcript_49274/g.143429 Transcript_49274/m.143429 type:complete len:364 (-) Transcript_49274:858-1949(-)
MIRATGEIFRRHQCGGTFTVNAHTHRGAPAQKLMQAPGSPRLADNPGLGVIGIVTAQLQGRIAPRRLVQTSCRSLREHVARILVGSTCELVGRDLRRNLAGFPGRTEADRRLAPRGRDAARRATLAAGVRQALGDDVVRVAAAEYDGGVAAGCDTRRPGDAAAVIGRIARAPELHRGRAPRRLWEAWCGVWCVMGGAPLRPSLVVECLAVIDAQHERVPPAYGRGAEGWQGGCGVREIDRRSTTRCLRKARQSVWSRDGVQVLLVILVIGGARRLIAEPQGRSAPHGASHIHGRLGRQAPEDNCRVAARSLRKSRRGSRRPRWSGALRGILLKLRLGICGAQQQRRRATHWSPRRAAQEQGRC